MDFSSDDFLLDDMEEIEKATGVPWSIANPLREARVARAFLAAALERSGRSEQEIVTTLRMLTLKKLRVAFEYLPDQNEATADAERNEAEEDDPLPLTSQDA